MDNKVNSGGPAFPYSVQRLHSSYAVDVKGMSLRAWFTGQALSGVIDLCVAQRRGDAESIARLSVEVADATIKALEVPNV